MRYFGVSLCLTFLFLCATAYGQSIPLNKVGGGLDFSKPLPATAFNTAQERELGAALMRISPQIAREPDAKRRWFAQRNTALSLARLGQQVMALRLAPDAPTRVWVWQILAKRKILAGKIAEASAIVPKLSGTKKTEIYIMLATSALHWRKSPKESLKWARLALQSSPKVTSLPLEPAGTAFIFQVEIAKILGQSGALTESKEVFARLESSFQAKKPNFPVNHLLSRILVARLEAGLRSDALDMVARYPDVITSATVSLALSGRIEDAVALGDNFPSQKKYKHLLLVLSYTGQDSKAFDKVHTRIEAMWKEFPSDGRGYSVLEYAKTLYQARHHKLAIQVLERELRGEELDTAMQGLMREARQYPHIFMEELNAATREKWIEMVLQNARDDAAENIKTQGGFYAQTEMPMEMAQLAFALQRFETVREELTKAEKARAKSPTINPEEYDLQMATLWRDIGEEKRAQQIEARVLRELNDKNSELGSGDLLRLAAENGNERLAQTILLSRRADDLDLVAFSIMFLFSYPTAGVPSYLMKIPDTTTRAVALAAFANHLWSVDDYYVMG